MKVASENGGEKAVDALPGDNLFRTFGQTSFPTNLGNLGKLGWPLRSLSTYAPPASGTGLTSNRAHFGRLPAFECISTKHVDHTSVPNSLLLMTPYPRVDQIVWIFGEESPLLPLFSIISKYRRLSRSRGSNESEEEGRKWTEDDAFRFSNDIGYRRYNSRSANPSIIVSVAITLPRLTII